MKASTEMQKYFDGLEEKTKYTYKIADEARKKGYDPEERVDVPLARNMAERVEGLISTVAPQLVDKGMPQRIEQLEKKYKPLAWEVALIIALEVAQEKFCKFKNKKEAMEIGIRTGFAYHTVGIVSAPLEGFVELKIKKRKDDKEYFAMSYAGPIRGAGGTAASVSIIIADYVRKKMGYSEYDPTDKEIRRQFVELQDYHERITNLQYNPSEEEILHLVKNCPIELDGDPTEKIDVSNYKDMPRVKTNRIRGGMCLVLSMLALKGPKLWKELNKWGKEFDINWQFLKDFLKVQKKAKSGDEKESTGLTPDYTFITDLVAGRPVLTHPLRQGGFRLRYGRSRISGYSASSIHPATMIVLNKYVATGTQLKTERPGKATTITPCDTIEGPIVKLQNGNLLQLKTETEAKKILDDLEEIIYLGDILFSYGDFYDRAHPLVPVGYNEEWHAQELKKTKIKGVPERYITNLIKKPHTIKIDTEYTLLIAKQKVLHPKYTYNWNAINPTDLLNIISWINNGTIELNAKGTPEKLILPGQKAKRSLELLGIPHTMATEDVVIVKEDALLFLSSLGLNSLADIKEKEKQIQANQNKDTLTIINILSNMTIRDKLGTFIGARMGRPEKAKMRKLTGSPHGLFPIGPEGGRMRSIQAALEKGTITADLPNHLCECGNSTILNICEKCGKKTTKIYYCKQCGKQIEKECNKHGKNETYYKQTINIKEVFEKVLKQINLRLYPDLIKFVHGTSNKDHIPEHLAKGILRAKNEISVNKDGTTRYDMSEIPITHFKPKEIGTNIEKLKKLGYCKDYNGKTLENEEQILELKPQDIILPGGTEALDDSANIILSKVAAFVDDELQQIYKMKPFYKINKPKDLVGHLVIGLAPHISAGIIGRIIGFSQTQGMLCHPLYHAAMRRDCDGDESCVILLMDALLNFSRQFLPNNRGGRTMDAPLVLTTTLNPSEVDDMVHKLDVASEYPLELYLGGIEGKQPWEVKVDQLNNHLGKETQFEGMGFTHDISSINAGVRCSSYKTLPSMEEKLKGQMYLAEKIRAVDESDVARLVIEKHFLKDIKGNLRKFSTQQFRCSNCNDKYRRPPLIGRCLKCKGKIIFTVSEGSVVKYLQPSISLANSYNISPYLKQTLEITKRRIEQVFGRDKEKQAGLGSWFG